MKTFFRLPLLFAALMVCFASCEKNDTESDTAGGTTSNTIERLIYCHVDNSESHQTLTTESEWEAMLDHICDWAHDGSEVTFYNMNQATPSTSDMKQSQSSDSKEDRTITTASREEMKKWMKRMEKEGLTVRVTYDNASGTWRGEAYATAPAVNTSGILPGTWHFSCMVVSQYDADGQLLSRDRFDPDDDGGSMRYTFHSDGTLLLAIVGMGGVEVTDNGTWSLSSDGVLSSQLLPNGIDWNVSWITSSTMILSRNNLGTADGDYCYQLLFESVTDAE